MRNVRALHNQTDYNWALKEVEKYFDNIPTPGTDGAERFDVLSALIREYEERMMEIPDADPIDVLKFAIESMGKTQADLARIIGSRSHASEILNRKKRHLTLDMIRDISKEWNLPIASLTDTYKLRKERVKEYA